jgi:phosphatidylinositol-3,4,5-trisphosphate 3-phosphatase and dual-specificity protein phosphatase PTEN
MPGVPSPAQYVRRKVSLQKRRYQLNGYDLDLAYILDNRLIAMGYPSQGKEKYFRNPMGDVQKFLEEFHKDHYKVYNLCIEREYDISKFNHQVSKYGFYDHQAPPVSLIGQFCADVQAHLDEDPENCAAIHCKAGKGRAGMMTCCFLMHTKHSKTAEQAMAHFAEMRTKGASPL